MCGLCGVLGASHWTDSHATPGAFAEGQARTRRHERLYRIQLANRVLAHYGLQLADFQGTCFVLSNKTGRSEIVDDLMAVWPAAAQMIGRVPDPLDPDLVDRLERSAGSAGAMA